MKRVEIAHVMVLQDGEQSMSWHYPEPGVAEIIHVQGRWSRDADAFAEAFGSELRAAGVRQLTWCGRQAWPRFLSMHDAVMHKQETT